MTSVPRSVSGSVRDHDTPNDQHTCQKLRLLFVTTGIKSNKTWLTDGSDYDLVLELLLTVRLGFMSKGKGSECAVNSAALSCYAFILCTALMQHIATHARWP
jgi:hypothetical protein